MARSETPEPNPFLTDPGNELPVSVQLSWQLRALIAAGRIPPGEQLPSVRVLASWSGLNANTVRAVYSRLEEAGLIVSQQGLGTFVADTVTATPQLEAIALAAVQESEAKGFDPRDLAIVVATCASHAPDALSMVSDRPEADDRGAEETHVAQELRRQIGRLESELAALHENAAGDSPHRQPLLADQDTGVQELRQLRDRLFDELANAQKAAERKAEERGKRQIQGPLERAASWLQRNR